jgi:photosystem II stability/assembly factor-like uncharacterized protein
MKKVRGAAALCCGILFCAHAQEGATSALAAQVLPAAMLQRLLLVDAKRVDGRMVAVGDRGYVIHSDDGGATWKRAVAPAAPLLTALAFADARRGLAVGHDSVILATADAGATWTQVFSAPAEQRPLLHVAYVTPDHAIAVGAYAAFHESKDGGRTWAARKITADDRHFNAVLSLGGGRLLILGEAGTLLASTDGGAQWSALASPYKGSFFGGLVADDGAVIAFGMRGRIYRSTDPGQGWTPVESGSVATLMGGDKLPDGTLVIAGAAGTVLVSRDNGRSFRPLPSGSTRAFAKAAFASPGAVMLLGEGGVRSVALPRGERAAP